MLRVKPDNFAPRTTAFAIACGLFLAVLSGAGNLAAAAAAIVVGDQKQLFIDDSFVKQATNVVLRMHPALKTGEQTLVPTQPWENASLNWFSVLRHDGKFRMWYECYDVEGWPTTNDTSFCYAESVDGLRWEKPNLGLFNYHGSTNNNILFREIGPPGAYSRVHGAGVFLDPTAPPAARYKCVSQGMFASSAPPYRVAGMVSADGLRWTRLPNVICDLFADSQYSAFWDAAGDAFVLYGRVGGRGRAIGRAPSRDFSHFEPLQLVLENEAARDLYNPAAVKYPDAANTYLMFPSVYDHQADTLAIHLAVSRDGIHWSYPDRATPFIPLGSPGQFDSGSLYLGQGLVPVRDELWHYYSGSPLKHEQATLELLTNAANHRIYSRAKIRLDGYVSAAAGNDDGSFVTPPLQFKGNALALNVAVRDGGRVRVGLLDEAGRPVPGLTVADCVPITGDHIRHVVAWNTKTNLSSLAAQPVCLSFQMTKANLFAFQFTDAHPTVNESEGNQYR
ncbi:MAG: hypothetical protein IT579_18290 [Verrucomicrobia subdivision 3 bacterium]|nr:hypothetical protein [Limisphaerales bacterium]